MKSLTKSRERIQKWIFIVMVAVSSLVIASTPAKGSMWDDLKIIPKIYKSVAAIQSETTADLPSLARDLKDLVLSFNLSKLENIVQLFDLFPEMYRKLGEAQSQVAWDFASSLYQKNEKQADALGGKIAWYMGIKTGSSNGSASTVKGSNKGEDKGGSSYSKEEQGSAAKAVGVAAGGLIGLIAPGVDWPAMPATLDFAADFATLNSVLSASIVTYGSIFAARALVQSADNITTSYISFLDDFVRILLGPKVANDIKALRMLSGIIRGFTQVSLGLLGGMEKLADAVLNSSISLASIVTILVQFSWKLFIASERILTEQAIPGINSAIKKSSSS